MRSYLPLPLELERASCPSCGTPATASLVRWDCFGFPIGQSRCAECGLIHAHPRATPSFMRDFYQSSAFVAFFEGPDGLTERVLSHHGYRAMAAARVRRYAPLLPEHGRALDVGCGWGLYLSGLQAACPGAHVEGIEPGTRQAAHARAAGLRIHVGTYESYRTKSPFDLISAFHVLEHLYDFGAFFAFCRAALAPGGYLALECPDLGGAWHDLGIVHLAHTATFSEATLRVTLRRHGFEVVSMDREDAEAVSYDRCSLRVVARRAAEGPVAAAAPREPELEARLRAAEGRRLPRILRSWLKLALYRLHLAGLVDVLREARRRSLSRRA